MSGEARTPLRRGLGRGLSALIPAAGKEDPPPSPAATTEVGSPAAAAAAEGRVFEVALDLVVPMREQPRSEFDADALEELARSISESGVLQPLLVRPIEDGRFGLIAGERRLRASRLAGKATVPVLVRDASELQAFELALVENIQREDLNPIEEAEAFRRLMDEFGLTQDDAARRVGKSRSTVANATRLLKLGRPIQDLIRSGGLSAGHARAVLSLPEAHHAELAERIVTEGLSVRAAEEFARAIREGRDPRPVEVEALAPPVAPSADETAGDALPAGAHDGHDEVASLDAIHDPRRGTTRPAPPRPRQPEPELRPALRDVQRRLQQHFGTRVVIAPRADGSGVLEIHFANDEVLQGVLDTIFF
jgi:ParB family chromosome partitioning protein